MPNVLFISEVRLKALTAIHDNVEPNDLMPYVLMAQDIYIQDTLGTTYYNNLKTSVSGSTLNSYEVTLIDDYISPTLANYALYLALPNLTYKAKNKAVVQPTSEESTSIGLEEIKYLRGTVLDTAQFYQERTKDYLKEFSIHFVGYNNYNVNAMAPNKGRQYSHGIVIPSPYGCGLFPNNPDPNS
jgi:hypothetical protein